MSGDVEEVIDLVSDIEDDDLWSQEEMESLKALEAIETIERDRHGTGNPVPPS